MRKISVHIRKYMVNLVINNHNRKFEMKLFDSLNCSCYTADDAKSPNADL